MSDIWEYAVVNLVHHWKRDLGNGYTVSVIFGLGSYGAQMGAFEMGLLDSKSGDLLIGDDNPFSDEWGDDVIGYLTFEEVAEWIGKLEKLPERNT